MRKQIGFYIALLVLFLFSVPVQAGEPAGSVDAFLNTIQSMEFPITDKAQHQQKVQQAAAYLDLEAMGKKSLGEHWDDMTSDEQKQFIDLLWKLIESIAYPRTRNFLGDQKITFTDTQPVEQGVNVSSIVLDAETDLEVPIVYHLYQAGAAWKIDDIFMDGVSMTEDLQYQFDKMIQDGSIQTLLDRMSERLEQAQKAAIGN